MDDITKMMTEQTLYVMDFHKPYLTAMVEKDYKGIGGGYKNEVFYFILFIHMDLSFWCVHINVKTGRVHGLTDINVTKSFVAEKEKVSSGAKTNVLSASVAG
ncbi:unnamed protein product [Cuscuta europaea]|uniref:Uncharacterized protein n=1 Tax=Cuscuta europaea TaxID=41803 RepID=A0A9P1DX64_CUSEU|nr:unnamed protein product [Cuscuta europaea]